VRVVVIGATGNIGTSVVSLLGPDPEIDEIVEVARRRPEWDPSKTTWVQADVAVDDLEPSAERHRRRLRPGPSRGTTARPGVQFEVLRPIRIWLP
jgi:hypothetical protein